MKYPLIKRLLVVFLLVVAWLAKPLLVWSVSSDDFQDTNYIRRDPEDYNYLPLILNPGSSTGGTGTLRDTISYNMTFDQGYEVQCAKPSWKITPQVYGALSEYFSLYDAPVTLSGSADYNIDFSGGRIPLFRGDEDLEQTQKNSSYEGFFGADYQGSAPPEVNSSGVANLLLNQASQCAVKYNNLSSIFAEGALCSRLSDSSQCALNRDIPNTPFTTRRLHDALRGLFALNNGERDLACGDVVGGWTEDLLEFGIEQEQFVRDVQPMLDALQIMPLNLDVLYRLAFLVIAPEQNITSGEDVFQFLQTQSPLPNQISHAPINEEKHAPIVIGFKVPMVATNSIFSFSGLRDPSILTADLAQSLEKIEQIKQENSNQREEFVEKIKTNKESKPVIDCEGLPQCTGGGSNQAMFQALIDIINGSELDCREFLGPYEQAGDLGSPALAHPEKLFNSPYGTAILPITNSAGFNWTLQVNNANVANQIGDDRVDVAAYLVTPYGTDLEYLQDSLQGVFFEGGVANIGELSEWEKLVQNNCIPDFDGQCGLLPEYFTFGGIAADLDSTSDEFTFITNPNCLGIEDEEELQNCQESSFGASVTEQPRDPLRILGAQVGWLIKQIQLKLRDVGNKAHTYISQCVRTEDLFLGRCLGFLGEPGGSDSNVANSCNDYQGATVDLPSWDGLQKMVCSVAKNNANDAQLLWGLLQIEGAPLTNQIAAGAGSMSCADLILNTCGASQIVGILVPACIDQEACSQASSIANDSQLQREITVDVACSVRGSLEYILQKRKSEISFLRGEYRAANGADPNSTQLYYMMAGRNYGLPVENLVQPACAGAPPVSGCSGANYCQCAMDTFSFSCN